MPAALEQPTQSERHKMIGVKVIEIVSDLRGCGMTDDEIRSVISGLAVIVGAE
jgi:hypothetical protein